MKALVVIDEHTYLYNGKIYLREFGHILIQRYLNIFDEIRVVARNKEVFKEEELRNFNIPITDYRIDFFSVPFFQGPKEYIKSYFKVQKSLNQVCKGCDIAIVRIMSTVGFTVLKKIRRNQLPYAAEIVADPKQFANSSEYILKKLLFNLMYRYQAKVCRKAIGISYVSKTFLMNRYPPGKFTKIITNYSSVELYNEFLISGRTFQKGSKYVLSQVSHPISSFEKGYRESIQILKTLRKKGYDVSIKFAGDGPLVSVIINYAKRLGVLDYVSFVGLLNKDELLEFLKSSDMMLLPSYSEGLPRVLIEASATGLPCLSTPRGGISDIVPNELLFEPNDINGFCTKIEELIRDKQLYEKMSLMAFEKSKEYTISNLTQKRNNFFLALKGYVLTKNENYHKMNY